MKLVVGLGNPGPEYAGTRHNAGFMVVDRFAGDTRRFAVQGNAAVSRATVGGEKVILLKPLTYMNRSGDVLDALLDEVEPIRENLLVVVDDIHLPLGSMRFRPGGSSGGHNGLASIEAAIATEEYPRLRIGVGGPEGDLIDHVLAEFSEPESGIFEEVVQTAVAAIGDWIIEGVQICQNRYNGWQAPTVEADSEETSEQ